MKWEYKVIIAEKFLSSADSLTVEEKFNEYGKDGWEFAGVLQKPYTTLGQDPKVDGDCIVLKRHVED
jgi:hypothetical protein